MGTTRKKSKTKSEYAETLGVSSRTINHWIDNNIALYTELVIAGYSNKHTRYWTPRQIEILDKHLK